MKRLIIISNRLPIRSAYNEHKKLVFLEADGGLVSAVKSYIEGGDHSYGELFWIGSLEEQSQSRLQQFKKNNPDLKYHIDAVFLEKNLYNTYYNGFCNSIIWPLFHYFPSYVDFRQDFYGAYESVNQAFADKIAAIAQPEDTIWIHDYHLMLLPKMLRDKGLTNKIGFFLHIPFPSYELYRMLPKEWREEIMQGLLATDLVGFHTVDYLNHFLKSAGILLGVDVEIGKVNQSNRSTQANFFPISIDFDKFYNAYDDPEVQAYREAIRMNNADKKIIFSIDRLDYTKGILNRLRIYEHFLKENPHYRDQVVFILSLIPSRDEVPKYSEGKRKIEEYISRINGVFGSAIWQPILYQYRQMSFEELCAHYTVCDLALITPIRDGMNLVAKEFVASRKNKQGVLVLSEMAGAANELSESLLINPNDFVEAALAIVQGLEMQAAEQTERMTQMQEKVRNYTVVDWAGDFLNELEYTGVFLQKDLPKSLPLDTDKSKQIITEYRKAKKRLLVFDYDGTLRGFEKKPQDATPSPEVLKMLQRLTASPQNDVFIVSGRRIEDLQAWFTDQRIGLIAEHGSDIKLPGKAEIISRNTNTDWKEYVKNIMNIYTKKSYGSHIEEKNYSMVWHYRNVHAMEGAFRAKELQSLLFEIVAGKNLQVLPGNKIVEVRVNGIDKGNAVQFVRVNKKYDFVLCMGDDTTDEDMFRVLDKLNEYTVKVGNPKASTYARYITASPETVLTFLQQIAKHTTIETKKPATPFGQPSKER
jgi:trehalose 6-phosphate synthase/phosphatase